MPRIKYKKKFFFKNKVSNFLKINFKQPFILTFFCNYNAKVKNLMKILSDTLIIMDNFSTL